MTADIIREVLEALRQVPDGYLAENAAKRGRIHAAALLAQAAGRRSGAIVFPDDVYAPVEFTSDDGRAAYRAAGVANYLLDRRWASPDDVAVLIAGLEAGLRLTDAEQQWQLERLIARLSNPEPEDYIDG